jgi:hypothetical protein
MRLLRHVAYTGMIWLTAAMTLVAAAPHFDCRCANGQVKPYCFSLLSRNDSCCDGSCCPPSRGEGHKSPASRSAEAGKKTCCCHDEARQSGDKKSQSANARGQTGCQKTLVKAAAAVPAVVKSPIRDLLAHALFCSPAAVLTYHEVGERGVPLANPSRSTLPPTDLITVLQHFLI